MADFRTAFLRTMAFEDDPRHPGAVSAEPHEGRARLGINSLAHPNLPDDFWTGPYEHALEYAERIFRHDYWDALKLDSVVSQDVANKLYDMAVNDGVGTAARLAQQAFNTLLFQDAQRVIDTPSTPENLQPRVSVFPLKVDGALGQKSIAAINSVPPAAFIQILKDENAARYKKLAAENPAEYGHCLTNWLERNEK